MNRTLFITTALALAAFSGLNLKARSQAATPQSTLQQLETMRAANQLLLEKQTALLIKLEDLQKEATQIKFFAKRG
jgi:hypothetical protein